MTLQKIYWTPVAIESLREVERFLNDRWNENIVNDFLDSIDVVTEIIRHDPEIAPKIEETIFRRFIVHRNVSLYYVNQDGYSKVLLIWDNRQNPERLFNKLYSANKN